MGIEERGVDYFSDNGLTKKRIAVDRFLEILILLKSLKNIFVNPHLVAANIIQMDTKVRKIKSISP